MMIMALLHSLFSRYDASRRASLYCCFNDFIFFLKIFVRGHASICRFAVGDDDIFGSLDAHHHVAKLYLSSSTVSNTKLTLCMLQILTLFLTKLHHQSF